MATPMRAMMPRREGTRTKREIGTPVWSQAWGTRMGLSFHRTSGVSDMASPRTVQYAACDQASGIARPPPRQTSQGAADAQQRERPEHGRRDVGEIDQRLRDGERRERHD